ncbi:apolipoprotein N-acyltransferase [Permianibacter sp. IMCC34836]|uniref:apolipoprotein N-acyltransferase n=1 Tax=Permianibacter fluminis TaxID=2738515 RepID=UPI00155281C1|nr:apolipoprotein N-acyltransferase [Permianibacter fluminis]NQD36853.1 apolipoprotein N-acyltransferase [Permianibacter fluminis]
MQAFLSRWLMTLIPVLAGALFPLAFAPIALPWFALLSLTLLLLSWQHATAKQAAWRGFLWGFAAFVVGVSWVHVAIRDFGEAPLALSLFLTGGMVAILALFPALAGWALVRCFPTASARLIAFAPLWVLAEYLRGHVFSGFPWLFAGYSQTDTWLGNLLPLLGVYGASLAVALLAALLLLVAKPQPGQRRIHFVARVTTALVLVLLLTPVSSKPAQQAETTTAAPSLSVALVQANIEQSLKWQPEQLNRILNQYQQLTTPLLGKVDAVIWPEAAIPSFAHYLGDYFPNLDAAARASNTALVTGLPVQDADGRYFNSIVGYGTAAGRYDKRHLVPFGEYVPFQSMLRGLFAFFNLPMSGFSEGEHGAVMTVAGQKMVGAVCYEIAYPELVRDNVLSLRGDPGYLLTVSNDAWFGGSWGPWQHLQIARTRAMENGLPVIRATVTGVSAIIDADGRIQHSLPQFETAILRARISAAKPDTLWVHWGLWPVSILIALLLGVAWGSSRRVLRSQALQSRL